MVLTDVTKRYGRRRGVVPALDRVSLSFAASSFTAVLGVSGSGKSTLLQCAAGLERPTSGTIRLCGTELAGASVVVAGDTNLHVTVGHGDDARQSLPLPAYRGVPAGLAGQLARVPGVAAATGEAGFPGGVVRPGDVDLVAVTAKPGVSSGVLAARIRAALSSAGHGGRGYTIATGPARGDLADLNAAVERSDGQVLGAALIPPIVMISLFAVSRAATGTWVPFIPLAPAAGLVLGVAALVAGAVMIPFYLMSRREPALASG